MVVVVVTVAVAEDEDEPDRAALELAIAWPVMLTKAISEGPREKFELAQLAAEAAQVKMPSEQPGTGEVQQLEQRAMGWR